MAGLPGAASWYALKIEACPCQGEIRRRRDFIAALGAAASVLPSSVRAQMGMPGEAAAQASKAPLVGFLNSASPVTYRFNADAFREGLAQAGFVEGRNVRIEERWANADYSALPALANELVAKGIVAIAATGDVASARAAQSASRTVPIVFTIGGDPVRFGLVASFNRPGGNLTASHSCRTSSAPSAFSCCMTSYPRPCASGC